MGSKLRLAGVVVALTLLTAACDWSVFGYDAANTKFNPETGLTTGNVGGVTRKWVANVQGAKSSRSTPAVVGIDGVKYVLVHTANGYLEIRRASDGAFNKAIWTGNAGAGDYGGTTSSPAVYTVPGTGRVLAIVGSMDGHVKAFDARSGAMVWQFPNDPAENDWAPVVQSPAITAGGNVLIPLGEKIGVTEVGFTRYFYALWRLDAATGAYEAVWGLGGSTGAAGHEPSSAAINNANGRVYVGLPGWDPYLFPDFTTHTGVLALNGADTSFSTAWQWNLDGMYLNGVAATPAVSGGRVFVQHPTGLRALAESNGGVLAGPVGPGSQYSSPAVAGDRVYVGTDNGYLRAHNTSTLAQVMTSGQNVDDFGNPVRASTPAITGQVYPTLDRYLVYVSFGNGDVRAWDADAGGTQSALWVRHDHGTGKGGVAVSGNVIYVQGDDGQLRAFGL